MQCPRELCLARSQGQTRLSLPPLLKHGFVCRYNLRDISRKLVDLAKDSIEMDFNIFIRYLLEDEDASVRVNAIDGLWEDEDRTLIPPLVGFLRCDPDARVRAAAAQNLRRFVLLREYGRITDSDASLINDALLTTIRSANEPLELRACALESLAY